MRFVPIVGHFQPDPPSAMLRDVESLSTAILRERPELAMPDDFRRLSAEQVGEGPTLHVDDLTAISRLDPGCRTEFYQDRARLRAGDGDIVVSCGQPVGGYEEYCCEMLGLGSPKWLHPRVPQNPMRVAEASWEDRSVRRTLVRAIRSRDLEYLHPHMGTLPIWELAFLLHRASHRRIRVVAPPPNVTTWANDKVAFTTTVQRLFGESFVPTSESAWNLSKLALRVQEIARQSQFVGLKLPDAAGGDGNVVIKSGRFGDQSLRQTHSILREALQKLDWDGCSELLVDSWESNVTSSPSVQMWIPPQDEGPPVIEGLFVQVIEGAQGIFTGSRPADLPSHLTEEIVDRCWLLGQLFQHVGYLGRCSFDMILVGDTHDNCQIEFIECNGRWGGTSLPMTLMNRLFGDWSRQPFAVSVSWIPGLDRVSFVDALNAFGDDLFDARTGQGRFILCNPGRMKHQSGLSAIGLGSTWDEAATAAFEDFPARLRDLVAGHAGDAADTSKIPGAIKPRSST